MGIAHIRIAQSGIGALNFPICDQILSVCPIFQRRTYPGPTQDTTVSDYYECRNFDKLGRERGRTIVKLEYDIPYLDRPVAIWSMVILHWKIYQLIYEEKLPLIRPCCMAKGNLMETIFTWTIVNGSIDSEGNFIEENNNNIRQQRVFRPPILIVTRLLKALLQVTNFKKILCNGFPYTYNML
uniref:Uncharacterized protein n=1 Tax=Romanomermis culicivorax TaxID=13658 RepID=A0A915JPQ6_ROMCU